MLPMILPVDARDFSPLRSRESGPGRRADGERWRDHLAADNAHLAGEVQRLREENESLRACAEIWIGLYERQLERANAAQAGRPPHSTGSPDTSDCA